jgi:PAS domain S-box-containing protein
MDSDNKTKAVRQLQDKPSKGEFLITGIGASAGGIAALQDFFRNVDKKTGVAYVVILHLSPDHDSQLAAILQRETSLPVNQVTQKATLMPDHVYVVPPDHHLKIEGDHITVSQNILPEERRAPIDIFFRSMADEHGPRAIAVVLSGTGANGSMGLKRIKERGGACFVQNPREAEYNQMPRNAIATDLVDEVLPVADIPEKILTYKKSLRNIEITDEAEPRPADDQMALREIFTQLRLHTGHDFTNYKRPTLLRRIERRINVHNLTGLPAYAAFLQENIDEPTALLKDLLISVTNFFRDKKPFEVIEQEIIPHLFKGKTSEDQVRIWVAGCATGEEAYTLAMLCAEVTLGAIDGPKVQIFATDIDEAAITHAREGLYTLNDTADVSPERLRRFFNKEGDSYRIRREIRETIMFAPHNVLKDPPFSHLDMVSCRNLMIYLNHVAQERVVETFHFALNPGGFLFFGTSESIDGASDLYSTYNRENHIFQRRQVNIKAYPVPESTPALYFEKFRKDTAMQEQEKKILDRISFGDLHQQLLEEYAPPSLVVNEDYEILHLTERAGQFLQISGGELSKNLLKLIKPELRLELRSALYQSKERQSAVTAMGLQVNVANKTETVNIHVRPVLRSGDTAKGFILVVFEPAAKGSSHEILISSDEPLAKQLEEELIRVKAQLRAASEQHDFQAEEMKASNEELQAMNEELRSAAEELETSKEELQSINEELRTVNQELKLKIEETSIANNNLQNIINSTDIGTIFLDRSFRVALYTPAAEAIFNLIPADNGRPLADITHRLQYNELLDDADTVLEKLNVLEKEITSVDGNIYLMRLAPYRTDEDRINGVVVTFVNISQSKRADEALRKSEERLRVTMESAIDFVIITMDINGTIEQWNTGAQRTLGYTADEVIGKPIDIIFTDQDRLDGIANEELKIANENGFAEDERWHRRKDGSHFYMSGIMRPIYNPELAGYVKVARDMTGPQKHQDQLRISEERHRIAIESAGMASWDWNIVDDVISWNENHYLMLGLHPDNELKYAAFFVQFIHEEDKKRVEQSLMHAVETAGEFNEEFRVIRADNNAVVWVKGYGSSVSTEGGHTTRMVGVMLDVTEQKLFTNDLSRLVDERTIELQRSNSDLQQFAHVASHDLKEPVRKIRTFYSRIVEEFKDELPEDVMSYLDRIEVSAERMYEMIEGVLHYSKLSNDNEPPKKVELAEVIDQIESDLEV